MRLVLMLLYRSEIFVCGVERKCHIVFIFCVDKSSDVSLPADASSGRSLKRGLADTILSQGVVGAASHRRAKDRRFLLYRSPICIASLDCLVVLGTLREEATIVLPS
eukprot:120762-Amphidinium_carterae.1